MAKFKQIPQNFLFRRLLHYWRNMVHNYNDDCRDDDFFDIVRNCFDHDRAVELIELDRAEAARELHDRHGADDKDQRRDDERDEQGAFRFSCSFHFRSPRFRDVKAPV